MNQPKFWTVSRINVTLSAIFIGLALCLILAQRKTTLWDFYSYYGAAKAVQVGVDPYAVNYFNDHLSEHGYSVGPHAYPPLTLLLLSPLALFSPAVAALLWCLLKVAAFFFTGWIVQRKFFEWTPIPYALPFLLLAFNAAFYWDLVTGNISMLEQSLIWAALGCLMCGRPALFTAIIVLAAQIKLPPVLFLGLLLVYDTKPKWAHFVAGAAAFFAVFQLNPLLYPEFTREFQTVAQRLTNEGGVSSASSLILIRELVGVVQHYVPNLPDRLDLKLFALFVAIAGGASMYVVFKYKRKSDWNRVVLLFFFCVTYAVVLPRFKSYQYAILVFPTLYLIMRSPRFLTWTLLFTMAAFPHPGTPFPGPIQKVVAVCFEYFPIIAVYVVWSGYAHLMLKPASSLETHI